MKKITVLLLAVLATNTLSAQILDSLRVGAKSINYEVIAASGYEDFAAAPYGDQLLFVSSRETGLFSKKYDLNNQKFFDLYLYNLKTKEVTRYGDQLASLKKSKFHLGPATLLPDSSGIFISRNFDKPDKAGNVNFYIYHYSFEEGIIDTLPFCFQEFSTQHPCFDSKKNRLYFSSNRPGGKGGYDIYYSDFTQNGGWGTPVNLKKVNTIRNEVFPTLTARGIAFSKNTDADNLDLFEINYSNDSSVVSMNQFNSDRDDFQWIKLSGDSSVFSRSNFEKFDSDLILTYSSTSRAISPEVYYSYIIPIDSKRSIADQADSLHLLYNLKFDSFVTGNAHIGFDFGLNAVNDSDLVNELDLSYERITSSNRIPWQRNLIDRKDEWQVDLKRQYGKGRFSSIVYKDSSLVPALQVLNEALQVNSRSFLYDDGKYIYVSGPKRSTFLQARMDSLNFKNSGLNSTVLESSANSTHVPIDKLLSLKCIDDLTGEKLNFDIRYYDYETQEDIYSASILSSENLFVAFLEDRVLGVTLLSEGYLPVSIKIENTSVPVNDIKVVVAEMTKIKRDVEQSFTLNNIHFDFNDFTPSPTALKELEFVLPVLKQYTSIKIIGHTDSKGSSSYNQLLSEKRSNAIMEYLRTKGIPIEAMQAVGKGEEFPLDTNETEEGRANNRRAEFIVK